MLSNLIGSEMKSSVETWEVFGFEPRTVGILELKEPMVVVFWQLDFKGKEIKV